MNRYGQVEEVQQVRSQSYSDRQFLHTYQSAAFVPLVQSTINAVMGMILTGVVLYLFDAIDYVKPILVMGALIWVGSWLYLQRRWFNLTALESRLNIDLNQDGFVGRKIDPEPEEHRIRVVLSKITEDKHYQSSTFDLPKGVTRQHLEKLAHDIFILHKPFTETECSGPPAGEGSIPTSRFRILRQIMKQQKLCEKTGDADNAPIELTQTGELWLKEYLPTSPTPLDDDD